MTDDRAGPAQRRRPVRLALLLGLGAVLVAALLGLSAWQIERRAWKLALIARVDARVHAPPAAPPADWANVSAARDEYRHVRVTGTFLAGREAAVQAVTERGAGLWVIAPLRTPAGTNILVNRGFIPGDRRDLIQITPTGPQTVTGLLRLTEPKGGFLRANDPAHDRWFSRDVAAIAASRRLGPTAPYFIDADATANAGGWPVGGLTVIAFPNNHLIYAITWFTLAMMTAAAMVALVRGRRR